MEDKLKLIDAYLDGELTPESAAALDAWLREDSDHLETFVRETHLHRQLHDVLCGQTSQRAVAAAGGRPDPNDLPPASPVLGFLANAFRQGSDYVSHPTPFSTLVAVATIGSLLTLLALWAAPLYRRHSLPRPEPLAQPEYVARLTRTIDCQWANINSVPMPGVHLRAGRQLELVEGLAEITFKRGARVILQGPTTFRVESADEGFLHRGTLTAKVPEEARGFAIRTPGVTVTDLGTEFGVEIKNDDSTEVHVFQGVVEAELFDQTGATRKKLRITEHQAARFDATGAEISYKTADTNRFVRELPQRRSMIIRFAGADLNVGGSFRTINPAKPELQKPLDADADNVYGTDGYVFFSTDKTPNDNGTRTLNHFLENAKISLPSYVSAIGGSRGVYSAGSYGYLVIDDPTRTPGAFVPNIESGLAAVDPEPGGQPSGTEMALLTITLGNNIPASGFRLGIFTDNANGGGLIPLRIRLAGGGAEGRVRVTSNNLDGDFYFFDVLGASPGNVLRLLVTKRAVNAVTVGGLTFDAIPHAKASSGKPSSPP